MSIFWYKYLIVKLKYIVLSSEPQRINLKRSTKILPLPHRLDIASQSYDKSPPITFVPIALNFRSLLGQIPLIPNLTTSVPRWNRPPSRSGAGKSSSKLWLRRQVGLFGYIALIRPSLRWEMRRPQHRRSLSDCLFTNIILLQGNIIIPLFWHNCIIF